jgi:hypothetical protein
MLMLLGAVIQFLIVAVSSDSYRFDAWSLHIDEMPTRGVCGDYRYRFNKPQRNSEIFAASRSVAFRSLVSRPAVEPASAGLVRTSDCEERSSEFIVEAVFPSGLDPTQFVCYWTDAPAARAFPVRNNVSLLFPTRFSRSAVCAMTSRADRGGVIGIGWCPVDDGEKEECAIEIEARRVFDFATESNPATVRIDLRSSFEQRVVEVGSAGGWRVEDGHLVEIRQVVSSETGSISKSRRFVWRLAWVPVGTQASVWCLAGVDTRLIACGHGYLRDAAPVVDLHGVRRFALNRSEFIEIEIEGMPLYRGGRSTQCALVLRATDDSEVYSLEQPSPCDGYMLLPVNARVAAIDVGKHHTGVDIDFIWGRYSDGRWLYDNAQPLGSVRIPEIRPARLRIGVGVGAGAGARDLSAIQRRLFRMATDDGK